MSKKPSSDKTADPVAETADPVAPDADLLVPAADGVDDGGVEAEEVTEGADAHEASGVELELDTPNAAEGNQPEAQQQQAETIGTDANEDQQDEAGPRADPVVSLHAEAGDDVIAGIARRIADMLVYHRAELISTLSDRYGLEITRSIEGVRVTMAGITASSPYLGPEGEYRALDNWANAARRKVMAA